MTATSPGIVSTMRRKLSSLTPHSRSWLAELAKFRERRRERSCESVVPSLRHSNLRPARRLPSVCPRSQSISMLRIVRSIDAGATRLTVSGRIDSEQLSELRRLVDEEVTRGAVLDLAEVTLVDMQAVRFLVQCEIRGVRLVRCPAYVREWMAREGGLHEGSPNQK